MSRLEKFGRILKRRREKMGLSQADISYVLGYKSPQLVSNWERGLCKPPSTSLVQIASILQIPERRIFALYLACVRETLS